MNIPRAEDVMHALITPRVLVRVLFVWGLVTFGGSFLAISIAIPGVWGTQAEAQGAMAPLWFDEFADTDIATFEDARVLFDAQDNDGTSTPLTAQSSAYTEMRSAVTVTSAPVFPTRMMITELGIDVPIANPTSTSVAVLDEALHDAVVRYPGSGTLEGNGNVLIFGHSSYLPVVRNPLYKAFNGIQNLTYGDEIHVQSGDTTYVYKVFNVRKASADEDEIPLNTGKRQITLLTCDSFGKKSDRFIVEAEFDRQF